MLIGYLRVSSTDDRQSMARVGVHARMPHYRYRDAGGGNGQLEHGDALDPWSGTSLVAGNARARYQRDQVRPGRDPERVRKGGNDDDHIPDQSERCQCGVDRPCEGAAT